MKNGSKLVATFGTSKARQGDGVFELAEDLGTELARAGYTVINGGYDGIMTAAAKGAAQAGGKSIGITCRAFKSAIVNEFITEEISTERLEDRLAELIKRADAYCVLPGGTGTLLELAEIWELRNKGFLPTEKPIVLLGDFWQPVVDLMR